jgi:adenosylcobinamide-GDP ribazoletransferase
MDEDQLHAPGPLAQSTATRGAERPLVLGLIAETAAMVRFYSRLPVPVLGAFDTPDRPPPFAIACRMLPIASLVLALPAALVAIILGFTALPEFFTAAIVTAVLIATTGALHEDGLADTVDGFGGGGTIARKLEIMKDSRIGSYGAAALVLALLARVTLLAALIVVSPWFAAAGLIAAAIVSRTLSLATFALLPAARPDGVASTVGAPKTPSLAIAGALTIGLALVLVAPPAGLLRFLIAFGVAIGLSLALGRLARAQIGGQTGDVIGAAQVLAEIGFLAGLLVI